MSFVYSRFGMKILYCKYGLLILFLFIYFTYIKGKVQSVRYTPWALYLQRCKFSGKWWSTHWYLVRNMFTVQILWYSYIFLFYIIGANSIELLESVIGISTPKKMCLKSWEKSMRLKIVEGWESSLKKLWTLRQEKLPMICWEVLKYH